jgi:hypothetical protein
MAYGSPTDRAAELRRYADMIGKTVTPMGAPAAPYSNPHWARLAQALTGAAFQGAATRAASREDERAKLASGNLARLLTGGQPIDVRMPRPTGVLAGMDRLLLGRGETIADDGSAIPVSPMGPDGTLDMSAMIEHSLEAGIDPLAAVGSAYQFETSERAREAQKLATTQAAALRTIRRLQLSMGDDGVLSPENQRLWDEALPNLAADVSTLDTRREIKDATGNVIGYENVNVFGQPTGGEKFIPVPKTGPTVNVGAGQKAFYTAAGTQAVTELGALRTKIEGNNEIVARLNIMEALLASGMETGPIVGATLPVRAILADLGLLSSEDARELTNQQVFQAASKYIIPRMRVEGSGASSDFEQNMFASATAKMGNTPEANRIIIAGMRAMDEHAREVLQMKEAYAIEHENLLGFSAEAEKHFKKNPIFQKYKTPERLAADITDGKIGVNDLWFDEDLNQFRILSEITVNELRANGHFDTDK